MPEEEDRGIVHEPTSPPPLGVPAAEADSSDPAQDGVPVMHEAGDAPPAVEIPQLEISQADADARVQIVRDRCKAEAKVVIKDAKLTAGVDPDAALLELEGELLRAKRDEFAASGHPMKQRIAAALGTGKPA